MGDDRMYPINDLIRKLGHPLDEIRCRTLRSIVNKLDRDLIALEDLVNNRELMQNLLEWFNRGQVSEEEVVLNLLSILSKHPSSAQTLADVGAVAFLTQLRTNLGRHELRELVEEILDNLCRVPNADDLPCDVDCIYTPRQGLLVDSESQPTEETGPTDVLLGPCPAPPERPSIGYFDRSSSTNTSRVTAATGGTASTHSEPALRARPHRRRLPAVQENGGVEAPRRDQPREPVISDSCVKTPFMPWLTLAPTDRNVIATTLSSLKHRNAKVVFGAVEFVRDVVLMDFPVEIFLQRTSLLKAIFTVVHSGELELVRPCTECLTVFCRRLMERIRYHQNPNNYCTKQFFTSKPIKGRGLARKYSPFSAEVLAGGEFAAGCEDVAIKPCSRFSVPGVCVELLNIALTLLGGVHADSVHPALMELLHCAMGVLMESVDVGVWSSCEEVASELVPRLAQLMEKWAALLTRYSQREERTAPESGLPRQLYLGLLIGLLKFCRSLVPVRQAVVILPLGVREEFAYAVCDETLMQGYPEMGLILLDFVGSVQSEAKHVWETVDLAGRNMLSVCQFLVAKQEGIKNVPVCLQHASSGVHALHFVSCTRFAREFVLLYSDICTYELFLEGPELVDGRAVLLNLLAHPNLPVQKATYGQAFDVIKDCLSVEQATDPSSTAYRRARFLIQRDVLYEVLNGGMCTENEEVVSLASSLLLHLLDGRSFMSGAQWSLLMSATAEVAPLLQCCSDVDSRIGRTVLELANPPRGEDARSPAAFTALRCATRLLLHPAPPVRAEGMQRVVWSLEREPRAAEKVGLDDGAATVRAHCNWLVADRPRGLERPPMSRAAYQADSLFKVVEILLSEAVEPPVRKSAGEQVAIFLQNPDLHEPFLQRQGLQFAVNMIKRGIFLEAGQLTPILPPCVTILRRLAHQSIPLCAELARDIDLFYALLRVGLYFNYDSQCKYDVSHLLVLLLFHELSRKDCWPYRKVDARKQREAEEEEEVAGPESTFLLPAAVPMHFKLPFRCPVYDRHSPFLPRPPCNFAAVLDTPLAQRGLRIRWAVACHGSLAELCRDLDALPQLGLDDEFTERLTLTSMDRYLLHQSLPHLAIRGSLHAAANATSHRDVHAAISRLLLLLHSAPGSVSTLLPREAWLDVFQRFVSVQPAVSADFLLLERVMDLLEAYMTSLGPHRLPAVFRRWLLASVVGAPGPDEPERPMRALLIHGERLIGETDSPRLAQRKQWMAQRVLRFFRVVFSHVTTAGEEEEEDRGHWDALIGEVGVALLGRVEDALRSGPFTHLAAVDAAVDCLLHATARPGWPLEGEMSVLVVDLCQRLVAAYLFERDDAAVSFMGQHAFRAGLATLGNVAARLRDGEDNAALIGGGPDLWLRADWLPALLGFRCCQVRALALALAARVAAHSAEAAKQMDALFAGSQPLLDAPELPAGAGLWSVAMAVLVDPSEASGVRCQAALALMNLLVRPLGDLEVLKVRDEEAGVTLRGEEALHCLLERFRVAEAVCGVMGSYYPYPFVVPREADVRQAAQRRPQNASNVSTNSTLVLDMNETVAATLESMARARLGGESGASSPLSFAPTAPPPLPQTGSGAGVGPQLLHSISAPSLVRAAALLTTQLLEHSGRGHLLRQLLELRLHALLMNVLDPELVEAYLRLGRYVPVLAQLCRAYAAVLRLLRALCLRDPSVRVALLSDARFSLRLVRLLCLHGPSGLLAPTVWRELAWLVAALLRSARPEVEEPPASSLAANLVSPLAARAPGLCAALIGCWSAGGETRRAALMALASVLAHKAAVGCKLVQSLDSVPAGTTCGGGSEQATCGAALMNALVGVYDSLALRTQSEEVLLDKYAVNNAMKTLLALSTSAKMAAIDAGLVESLVEYMKYLQNKLHIDVVVLPARIQQGKPAARPAATREVALGYLGDLSLTVDVLHNLVFASAEAKQACVDAGLAQTVHRMWTLCQLDERLMVPCLRLLINFTAACPPAAASLAFTSPLASSDAPGQHSASSLVHSLVRFVGGTGDLLAPMQRESPVLVRLVYALLCNLVWSPEARGVLWKSKFLHRFSELHPKSWQKSRAGQQLQAAWLRLLLNLSFLPDGQRLVARVPDSLNILTDQVETVSGRQLFHALLVLRNLCTNPNVRPKLMAAECRLIPCLNRYLNEENPELCQLVLSALKALLYNNQKAKVSLKTEGFLQKALEMMDRCQSYVDPPEPLFSDLRVVLAAMRE